MQFTHFIGIDVSKGWLDFSWIGPESEEAQGFRVANNVTGVKKALRMLKKAGMDFGSALFCLEHTGIYCNPFLNVAIAMKLLVGLESAWKIKQTHSPRGKNDKLDAQRICQYAKRFHDKVSLWKPDSEITKKLKQMMAIRGRLIKMKLAMKAPIKELKDMKSTEGHRLNETYSKGPIKELEAQIKAIEKEISMIISEDADFAKSYKLITSIRGIGRQTAIWMILFTDNFTRFTNPKKLACFGGVAPFEYSSGSSFKGRTRVSHYANKQLKCVLHMAAIGSVKNNLEIKAYFKRKVGEGKHKMKVINAVRNKIIHTIFAIIKRQEPWTPRPNYLLQKNVA